MSNTEILDEEDVPPPKGFAGWKTFIKAEWQCIRFLAREFTTTTTRRFAALTLAGTALMVVCSAVAPLFVGQVINGLVREHYQVVVWSIVLFLSVWLIQHTLSSLTGAARERVLGLNHCRLDERVTELFMGKSLGQHERHGSRLNHASIEKAYWKVMSIQDNLVWMALPSLIRMALALCGLMWLSAAIGFVGICVTAMYVAWALYLNFRVGQETHPLESGFRRHNRVRVERWEKIARVETNGKALEEQRTMSATMLALMKKDMVFWGWFVRQTDIRNFLIQRTFQAGVLAYGAYMVYAKEWELGVLFPLLVWTDMLVNAQLELSTSERRISQDMISVQLMIETLSLPPAFNAKEGAQLKRNGPLKVAIDNLSFAYHDEARGGALHPVLRDINLTIEPGERVALIGPSGSGKTTIMKLLLRYDDPTEGEIRVGGMPLRRIALDSYMHQVGYIPQHAQIFDGTIEDNLLYGVSPEERTRLLANDADELWKLMRSLKIDFGARLSRGLKTLVGRHGLKLSGGQAQRVMIGAAVAKRPRFMIIDEATSNLDSSTEREVQEGLSLALTGGTTALIVAHRLSTVRHLCSRFVVLRPIEEVGEGENQIEAIASSFGELYRKSPTFKQLADDQGVVVD